MHSPKCRDFLQRSQPASSAEMGHIRDRRHQGAYQLSLGRESSFGEGAGMAKLSSCCPARDPSGVLMAASHQQAATWRFGSTVAANASPAYPRVSA